MDMATHFQILDEAVCISHISNTNGEWIQLFSPAMGEMVGQTEIFSLGMLTSLGEGKLCIQTC